MVPNAEGWRGTDGRKTGSLHLSHLGDYPIYMKNLDTVNVFIQTCSCTVRFAVLKAEHAEKSSTNCICHNDKVFLQTSACGVIFLKLSDQTAQTFSGIRITMFSYFQLVIQQMTFACSRLLYAKFA